MDREYAKSVVKDSIEQYLEGTGRPLKKPFHCLSPESHKKGTGDAHPSMSYDKKRKKVHCFACGADYDTFDLISIDYGLKGNEVFNKAFEYFGLVIDEYHSPPSSGGGKWKKPIAQEDAGLGWNATIGSKKSPAPEYDFTAQAEAAHKELLNNTQALEYFYSRGITLETIKAYKVGYNARGYNDLVMNYPELKAKSRKQNLYNFVYPVYNKSGKCTYLLTEISDRKQTDQYNGKYRKMTGIGAQYFNTQYLESEGAPEIVYICEGTFDALSIEQLGGKAIALCGTGGNKFQEIIAKNKPNTFYIIAMDSDGAGTTANEKLKAQLEEVGAKCMIAGFEGGKDANDLLRANPKALADYINSTTDKAKQLRSEEEERERQEYLGTAAAYHLQNFINDIRDSEKAAYHSTGFPSLDSILDGGLYAGLYCIGAISSLGKTTFCLQVADTIAASGTDVIIFSLEMARNELIAKSVSRHTLLEDLTQNNSTKNAKTTRGILTGSRYRNYSKDEKAIIESAITAYSKYAEHIYINVGIGDIGINEIREVVENHVKLTGNTPVILIDYLQIIAPADPRSTDKQNTDKAVLELKKMSRDFSTAIIGISSFNRDNYHSPVNLASFKESGAIEYSSDVLIGLQYFGMDYQEGESEKNREKRVRDLLNSNIERAKEGKALRIEVKILKNRNGSKGACLLDFYPMFNYFVENNRLGEEMKGYSLTGSTTTPKEQEETAPKLSKREQQRQELVNAFFKAESSDQRGQAALEDMADALEVSKRTVRSRLAEYEKHFTVEGETVKYIKAEKERLLYSDEVL